MLLMGTERLRRTDIADHALDALAASRVREVVILGRRGDFRYTVARPFSIGAPFEKQENGRPVGKKIAYGEEYSSLIVPERLREGFTSILAYSATARTAI